MTVLLPQRPPRKIYLRLPKVTREPFGHAYAKNFVDPVVLTVFFPDHVTAIMACIFENIYDGETLFVYMMSLCNNSIVFCCCL